MSVVSPSSESALPETRVSPTVRTVVTLLIIFHLFALLIAVATNAYPLSALRNKLTDAGVYRWYLDALHMNLAYNFHLTNADERDVDHFLELQVRGTTPQTLRLPEAGLAPGIRRERFQQLALNAVPGEGGQALLASAIATGWLAQRGAPPGTHLLRIRRQTLVAREEADHPDRARSDPAHEQRFQNAYQANLLSSQGAVDLVEIVPEAERAEVRGQPEP